MQLFNPERLPGIKDVPGLAEYGQGLVKAYAQYVLPSFESSEDLQPGDGAVVQKVGGISGFMPDLGFQVLGRPRAGSFGQLSARWLHAAGARLAVAGGASRAAGAAAESIYRPAGYTCATVRVWFGVTRLLFHHRVLVLSASSLASLQRVQDDARHLLVRSVSCAAAPQQFLDFCRWCFRGP